MSHRKIMFGLPLSATVGLLAAVRPGARRARGRQAGGRARGRRADLQATTARSAATRRSWPTCRKDAVFTACGESDATFLGEDGSRRTPASTSSRSADEKEDDTYVQVYAPAQKEVLPEPNDPFFSLEEGRQGLHDREGEVAQVRADARRRRRGSDMPGKGYSSA